MSEVDQLGVVNFTIYYYFNWSGRFVGFLLYGIEHMLLGYNKIWLQPMLIIISNIVSLIFLIKCLTKESFINSSFWALVCYTLYISFIPEPFSAFFWNCSSNYMFGLTSIFLFFGSLFNLKRYWLLLVITSIHLSGTFELMAISFIPIMFIVYIGFLNRKSKYSSIVLLTLILSIVLLIVQILAPGNFVRLNSEPIKSVDFISSFSLAIYNTVLLYLKRIFIDSPLLILLIVFSKSIKHVAQRNRALFDINSFQVLMLIGLFGSFIVHHFVSLYGAGYPLQGRSMNLLLLLPVILVIWLFGACLLNFEKHIEPLKSTDTLKLIALSGIMIFLPFHNFNKDLIKESFSVLPSFYSSWELRNEAIKRDLDLPTLSNQPTVFRLPLFENEVNEFETSKYLIEQKKYHKEKTIGTY